MQTLGYHNQFSPKLRLIVISDQLNRKIGVFIEAFSKTFLAFIVLFILTVPAILFYIVTTIFIRIALEVLAKDLTSLKNKVKNQDDRSLMLMLPELETVEETMKKFTIGMNRDKPRRAYFTLLFGTSWSKCISRVQSLILEIERKVYPNLNDEPSEEQLNRLLKEYQKGSTLV